MDRLLKKNLVKNEYYILLVLYFILVIYILIKIFGTADYISYINNFNKIQNKEHFSEDKIENKNIFAILVNIFDSENIFYKHLLDETLSTTYIGTYFCKKNCFNNIYQSQNLKLNNWVPFKNLKLPDKLYPYNITYRDDKHLLLNVVDKDMNFSVFSYSNENKRTTKLFDNKKFKINIMSLLFDNKNNVWLGVSYDNGQIYENNNVDISKSTKWTPVNVDLTIRIKKIMYDIDGYLIALGNDNFMYKKNNINWRDTRSKWDKTNVNKIKDKQSGKINKFLDIYDLIYDKDRCFIATTSKGIYKQKKPGFDTEFLPIISYKDSNERNLGLHEIISLKTGIDFSSKLFDGNHIEGKYNEAYKTKMRLVNLCLDKKRLDKEINYETKEDTYDDISNVNNEIYDLYDVVNKIHSKYKNRN